MTSPHDHLDLERDLDAIADVLAGEAAAPDCATCAAVVAELEAASGVVTAALGALPVPVLPDDLATRLDAALREVGLDSGLDSGLERAASGQASVTTLPTLEARAARGPRGPRRWLPAAAAAVVLAGGGLLAAQTLPLGAGDSADEAATGMTGASESGGRDLVRNDSGNAYTEANLASAVPGLLTGQVPRLTGAPAAAAAPLSAPDAPADSGSTGGGTTGGTNGSPTSTARGQAPVPAAALPLAVDPLATLRTTPGLAACLAALLPPDDDSVQPLALDYGTFSGQPALLVLLPVPQRSDKVDVFVVGAGCAQADEQLLFFQRVDRPS